MPGYVPLLISAALFGIGRSRSGINSVFGGLVKSAGVATRTLRNPEATDEEKELASRNAAVSVSKNLVLIWVRLTIVAAASILPVAVFVLLGAVEFAEIETMLLDPFVLAGTAAIAMLSARLASK